MKRYLFFTSLICLAFCFPNQVNAQYEEPEKKVILTNEATINSEKLEYSPAFYEDGIVFISTKSTKKRYNIIDKRINQNIMSIFLSRRSEDGLLLSPVPFAPELLTPVHEGPLSFNRTNEFLYFTRNNYKDGKRRKAKDGEVKLKIYEAESVDSTWKNIVDLPFNDNNSNTMHPSMSAEDDVLYFASDRPGGMGGIDLYKVKKTGGAWGEPINLGPTINTEGNEVFPFIHADGTLYFASNTHSGYGGYDIFSATENGELWDKPVNLEKPFNSENDDFGMILDRDKKNGYFTSNRAGGLGQDDIYSFYITTNLDNVLANDEKKPTQVQKEIQILVIDHESGEAIPEATVNYMNLDDMTIARAITSFNTATETDDEVMLRLSMEESSQEGITDYGGKYPLVISNGNYVVNVKKAGYEPRLVVLTPDSDMAEILVSLQKEDPNKKYTGTGKTGTGTDDTSNPNGNDGSTGSNIDDVINTKISEGTVFELPNIYYNFNDASIRPDARVDLDALVSFLSQYPDIEIELNSHTDSRGGTRYNRRLSQKRANNVIRYLTQSGIDRSRLVPVGMGEQDIRNQCTDGVSCSELEHQYNRRTEVKIIKIDKDINIRFVNNNSQEDYTNNNENSSPRSTESFSENYEGDYKVIVGVFEDYSNAQTRLSDMQNIGQDASSIEELGGGRHYVIANRFSTLDEARDFSRSLKRNHGFRSWIRR